MFDYLDKEGLKELLNLLYIELVTQKAINKKFKKQIENLERHSIQDSEFSNNEGNESL